GNHIMKRIADWPKKHSLVGDVRGRGLMIGVEIVKDKQTKEYAGPERDRIVELAFERGVLFLGCGPSTIRLAPPLVVTKDEAEAIEALRRDYLVELSPGDARRNLVTRDVPLNHLVGKEFFIGEVKIRGIRLCEPCDHLQQLTGQPVIKGLLHRGGLRAQILSEGTIHVGDVVRA